MKSPAGSRAGFVGGVLACTAGATGAPEADDASPPALTAPAPGDPSAVDLVVEITAGAWIPRAGGATSLGGRPVELDAHLDLDDMTAAPNLELRLRTPAERWWIMASGFAFGDDTGGRYDGRPVDFGDVPLRVGEAYRASLDMWSVALEVGTERWRPYERAQDGGEVDVSFSPFLGARVMDVELEIERPGVAKETLDGSWVGLHAGLETRFRWSPPGGLLVGEAFSMEASYAFGLAAGGDGGSYWQVRGGVGLEITPTIDAMLGYRLLELDVDASSDDGNFDAGLQGLFLALRMRF